MDAIDPKGLTVEDRKNAKEIDDLCKKNENRTKKQLGRQSLATAKLEIMKVMGNAVKGTDNPYFKSMYADLKSVNDTIMSAMKEAKQFLLIEQYPFVDYNIPEILEKRVPRVEVLTRITDTKSGEFEEHRLSCFPAKDDPQAIGSSITYLRRYSLMPIFNISPADDDGNAGSGKDDKIPKGQRFKDEKQPEQTEPAQTTPKTQQKAQEPAQTKKPAKAPPTDEEQAKAGLISQAQIAELQRLRDMHKIDNAHWKGWLQVNYQINSAWFIKVTDLAKVTFALANNPHEILEFPIGDDVVK
jgi:hypothetical protein